MKSLIGKNVGRIVVTDTTRKKQSLTKLGKKDTPKVREIKRLAAIKRWADPKYYKKQKLAIKNGKRIYIRTKEQQEKINKSLKGKKAWNKGYGDYMKGSKNPMYRDGSSIIYPPEFDNALRQQIRVRDNYTCQLCYRKQGKRQLAIHHIDGNKNNSNVNNLTSLCQSCHQKIHVRMLFYNIFFKPIVLNPTTGKGSTAK